MATVFLLVDVAHGRYLDLDKFCPDFLLDLRGSPPLIPRTLERVASECLDDLGYSDCLRSMTCAGDVYGHFTEDTCVRCGLQGALDPAYGGLCQRCEWG